MAPRPRKRSTPPLDGPMTPAPDETHRDTLASYVAHKALKWTRQREVILDTFLSSQEHLTCEEIHARVVQADRSIGLATVYRTLRLFVEAGIASERRFQEGVTRYEPQQPHHDHLICVRCGKIVEFESDEIEELQDGIARSHGFTLLSHRHELYGACPECADG
jgi:Fur family ferric uptake transcriptional regulator